MSIDKEISEYNIKDNLPKNDKSIDFLKHK